MRTNPLDYSPDKSSHDVKPHETNNRPENKSQVPRACNVLVGRCSESKDRKRQKERV